MAYHYDGTIYGVTPRTNPTGSYATVTRRMFMVRIPEHLVVFRRRHNEYTVHDDKFKELASSIPIDIYRSRDIQVLDSIILAVTDVFSENN